ncbi:MAG TPA: TauD/TfdA family dioxygenase [Pyrinomonadaceae bacterium]|nr:TauD/TfdA family dioxygenase [Pyrinomonadaceae bacterium]
MNESVVATNSFKKFKTTKPQVFRVSQERLIKTGYLEGEGSFPLVIEPEVENLNVLEWVASQREMVERELLKHGAILFRNFKIEGVSDFEQFARTLTPQLMNYKERAAPRSEVGSNVYTSTEFPADQTIPLHHEMAYTHNWPMKLWFNCVLPAESGGATPITSDRKIINLIAPDIKKKFIEKEVMYVRNYGEGVDMPWQVVFQTTDRAVVEEYCRNANTEVEWRDGNRLRTRQRRQAVATHPKTGETVWFNHAHLFHVSNLEPQVREALLSEFKEDELPRNAFYGDGTSIETEVLDEIRDLYHREAVIFPWQRGDILMLDNMLASHGREPFVGDRKVIVAMAEPFLDNQCISDV